MVQEFGHKYRQSVHFSDIGREPVEDEIGPVGSDVVCFHRKEPGFLFHQQLSDVS